MANLENTSQAQNTHQKVVKVVFEVVTWTEENLYLLLLRKKDHHYDLAGGKVEDGDSIFDTAKKELEEELGYNIEDISEYRRLWSFEIQAVNKKFLFDILIISLSEAFTPSENPDEDHDLRLRFSTSEIEKLIAFQKTSQEKIFQDSVLYSLWLLWKEVLVSKLS